MRQLFRILYCLWFGHSWKLIWKEGIKWNEVLHKMVCKNCNKTVYLKTNQP